MDSMSVKDNLFIHMNFMKLISLKESGRISLTKLSGDFVRQSVSFHLVELWKTGEFLSEKFNEKYWNT